jgi:putative SOS response-associated peptidase YedK
VKPSSSAAASFLPMASTSGRGRRSDGNRCGFIRHGGLLLFASLYEKWYPGPNRGALTFTIIACAASALFGRIHDRMPVVLNEARPRTG